MKRYVKLFEELTDEPLFITVLYTNAGKRFYVFKDEADQETMYDELLEKNPNMPDSRRWALLDLSANAEIDVPEAIQRAWDDEVEMTNDELDRAYAQLGRVDREKVDDRAVKVAEDRGFLALRGYDQYSYYEVDMYVDSVEGLLELVEKYHKKGGMKAVEAAFDNLDWLSKEGLARFRRGSKTRNLFGV